MEAEYKEASEAAKEVVFFRTLLSELGYVFDKPTPIYEDNKACIAGVAHPPKCQKGGVRSSCQ